MHAKFTLAQINTIAAQVIANYPNQRVFALHGTMGVGKTTFAAAFCSALHVTHATSSPTYAIINTYQTDTSNTIYHLDLYRLKDEDEAIAVGVEDCFYSGNYCLVEWPNLYPNLLPDNTVHIYFTLLPNQQRQIEIT
jgi:tRNA threonylcarbamoyladenosine biosynthesis protein TsaE